MNKDIKEKLEFLKFTEHGFDAMRCAVEDVEYIALEHPFKGLHLIVMHHSERTHTYDEYFMPADTDVQTILHVILESFEKIHPERKNNKQGRI